MNRTVVFLAGFCVGAFAIPLLFAFLVNYMGIHQSGEKSVNLVHTEINTTMNKTSERNEVSVPCWVGKTVIIRGRSMLPTFHSGERAILLRGYYKCNRIKRGDVVAISIKTLSAPLIKRVVAVAGDRVEEINGFIYVDGKNTGVQMTKVLETQLQHYDWLIPPDTVMVLSDNPSIGMDSRSFGLISTNQILGKVIKEVNQ